MILFPRLLYLYPPKCALFPPLKGASYAPLAQNSEGGNPNEKPQAALSLALAAIMLVGMMVVSASAASYNDLTDKDQIVNKDAVSMLVSLGIIEASPTAPMHPPKMLTALRWRRCSPSS
mgnify:CR=1 FL=1